MPLQTANPTNDSRDIKALDEAAPLLPSGVQTGLHGGPQGATAESYGSTADKSLPSTRRITPLPLGQLFVLCAMRIADPISYTQIFPYINKMMEDLKVTENPADIGYYSGVVESIFALCALFTTFQWGRLSDRIGRKPVLLSGLAGVTLSTVLFGLSKSFWYSVFARCLAGALSGNVPVMLSVIGEITDETNQAEAFPLMGLTWNLGSVIGPIIGGTFANPVETFPKTFGSVLLFKTFPYLLPCLIAAVITFISITLGIIYLKESLPSRKRNKSEVSSISSQSPSTEVVTWRTILSSAMIRSIFKSFFLLSGLATCFDVVFILFAYTPIYLGGLSREPEEIGYAMALSGVLGAVIQVFTFPFLQRYYGNVLLYRRLMLLWPVLYGVLPLLNVVARLTMPELARIPEVGTNDIQLPASRSLWLCIAVLLALFRLATMAYSVNMILVNNAVTSKAALGSTFGLLQSVSCIARTCSPAFVSSLFAFSNDHQVLGGYLVWIVMFIVALCGLWVTYQIKDVTEARSPVPSQ